MSPQRIWGKLGLAPGIAKLLVSSESLCRPSQVQMNNLLLLNPTEVGQVNSTMDTTGATARLQQSRLILTQPMHLYSWYGSEKLTVFCRPPVKMNRTNKKTNKQTKTHAKNSEGWGPRPKRAAQPANPNSECVLTGRNCRGGMSVKSSLGLESWTADSAQLNESFLGYRKKQVDPCLLLFFSSQKQKLPCLLICFLFVFVHPSVFSF